MQLKLHGILQAQSLSQYIYKIFCCVSATDKSKTNFLSLAMTENKSTVMLCFFVVFFFCFCSDVSSIVQKLFLLDLVLLAI